MEPVDRTNAPIRFGVFEVDARTGELRRSGTRLRIQEQPFQLLLALLEHPGQLITRDELVEDLTGKRGSGLTSCRQYLA
jgi:DNA-binding winged helix-turn-helix (wHTH) protein